MDGFNNEDIYDRICLYLQKNGIDVDDSPIELFMLYDNVDGTGIKIGKWNIPIDKPKKKDLAFTKDEMNQFVNKRDKTNKLKKIKNNELYKIVELLCLRLNIDINELLSEL